MGCDSCCEQAEISFPIWPTLFVSKTFQEFSLYDPRDGKLRSQLKFCSDVLTAGACAFCPSAGDLTFDDQAWAC